MPIHKALKLLLNPLGQTIFREKLQKLSLGYQFFTDIKSAYEFSLAVYLWVGRPPTVVAQPIPHILIFKNVVVGKLYILRPQQVEECLGEAALWLIGCALDEDDDW